MVGGALWVVPTVQVINLSPASAQAVSNPPPTDSATPPGPPADGDDAPAATPVVGRPTYAG
jgi:hypothetical protein